MNTKKIWANLAVSDLNRTTQFYKELGFKQNGKPNDQLTSFKISNEDFIIHFFIKEQLQTVIGNVADLKNGNEIIFSLAAESEEEVKDWGGKAKEAGGTVFKEAGRDKDGYYYCVFADPDGHKFNALFIEEGM